MFHVLNVLDKITLDNCCNITGMNIFHLYRNGSKLQKIINLKKVFKKYLVFGRVLIVSGVNFIQKKLPTNK